MFWALPDWFERIVIVLSESNPTAMTVRRIIRDNVTTRAKPLCDWVGRSEVGGGAFLVCMGVTRFLRVLGGSFFSRSKVGWSGVS
jgi:hypothetical protein